MIVENGTLPTERAVATTLGDLTDAIAQLAIAGPAVIFVGLDWETPACSAPRPYRLRRPRTHSRPAIAAVLQR